MLKMEVSMEQFTNDTNTMKQVRKITKTIQKMDDRSKMDIGFSCITLSGGKKRGKVTNFRRQ